HLAWSSLSLSVRPVSQIVMVPPPSFMRPKGVSHGYKGWLVEFAKRWFGIIVDIVQRPAAQREFVVQPQRWKIERTFGWLDWSRVLSKEYERTTESSESDIYLASIRLMLRRLASSSK